MTMSNGETRCKHINLSFSQKGGILTGSMAVSYGKGTVGALFTYLSSELVSKHAVYDIYSSTEQDV